MDRWPFSTYDFVSTISSGAVAIIGVAYSVTGRTVFEANPSPFQASLLVLAAFIGGHVVQHVSHYLLESVVVGKILGTPTAHLFSDGAVDARGRLSYKKPLPPRVRQRVLETADKREGVGEPGEDLFFACLSAVRRADYVRARLAVFLNLYGFARNVAVSLALVAIACTVRAVLYGNAQTLLGMAAVLVLLSVMLTLRFLKFYRLYAVEVFANYVEVVK